MTLQQIEANRRNALRNTGPKTAEGKAHVRLTRSIMECWREKMSNFADLERAGAHEEILMDLIVRQISKLKRAGRLEAAILAAETYRAAKTLRLTLQVSPETAAPDEFQRTSTATSRPGSTAGSPDSICPNFASAHRPEACGPPD